VDEGASLSEVTVVLDSGTERVDGTVRVVHGVLPADAVLTVTIRRTDRRWLPGRPITDYVDPRDRSFGFRNLMPGEHELTLEVARPGCGEPRTLVRRTVTVTEGADTSLLVDVDVGTGTGER